MLSTGKGDYQQFIVKLFGTEIYFYRNSDNLMHEFMHTLVGTFITRLDDIEYEGTIYHPLSISLPPRYSRAVYFKAVQDRDTWLGILKEVSQTYDYDDFYTTIKELGEGSMGTVKLAKHKKTGAEYAVKYMKKAKKNEQEILYQKREIEALKMCQHPNLIKLVDLFETSTHYYIVIELCSGGDMYDYLEKRDFRISEQRAWELAT